MIEELKKLKESALEEISKCSDEVELNNIKSKYMGKKSTFTDIMSKMGTLSNEEKKEVGMESNVFRTEVTEALENKSKEIKNALLNEKLNKDKIDLTLPSKKRVTGSMHPLTLVENEVTDLFVSMGYDVAYGPEVECDKYCFEMLNVPKDIQQEMLKIHFILMMKCYLEHKLLLCK